MTSDTAVSQPQQPPETTSDIAEPADTAASPRERRRPGAVSTTVPERFAEVFVAYVEDVTRPGSPLDADTVRAYISRVRQFFAWLAESDVDGDPLTDPAARDWAARDYRTWLLTVRKRTLSTVNAHLTALDDFFRRRGLGPAAVVRQEVPKTAPRALKQRDQLRWLRAAERAAPRDRALALLENYAGVRGGEAVALDVDDVRISARKGVLIVRYGKGGRYREVPVHSKLRPAIEAWLTDRASWTGAAENPALFLNRRGGRLSVRGAYDALKKVAEDANLPVGRNATFTPHVLRHSAITAMIRDGEDVVLVAEIVGQSIETTRRYSLPTDEDKQRAIERLVVDE